MDVFDAVGAVFHVVGFAAFVDRKPGMIEGIFGRTRRATGDNQWDDVSVFVLGFDVGLGTIECQIAVVVGQGFDCNDVVGGQFVFDGAAEGFADQGANGVTGGSNVGA